ATLIESLLKVRGPAVCGHKVSDTFIVAIHEGVHSLDEAIQVMSDVQAMKGPGRRKAFYLPSMERLSVPFMELPQPNQIFEEFWRQKTMAPKEQSSSGFVDFYRSYIEDPSTTASKNFLEGLSELNAYTHGLISSTRISVRLGKSIPSLFSQRSGVLFFLTFTKIYFSQLRRTHPELWNKLILAPHIKDFVSTLVVNAIDALEHSRICMNANADDRGISADLQSYGDGDSLGLAIGAATTTRLDTALSCLKVRK
ncbi:MAG: hypothetical protein AB7P49_13420, partial [Bdellovibrionales bacterium]